LPRTYVPSVHTPKSTSPILNKIEQEIGGVSSAETKNNSEKSFRYDAGAKGEERQTYISSSSHMTAQASRFNPTKLGREKNQTQEVGFLNSEEKQNSLDAERYLTPNRVDINELGRENQFQMKEMQAKKMDYEPLH